MSRFTADVNVKFHPCSKAVGKRHRREQFQPLTNNDDVSVLEKHSRTGLLFVCLFRVFRTTRELFTHFHHYLWRATDFDLYSALMAIEQWRSFNVPHLLWHGPTAPFIMAISEDPWHSHRCQAFGSGAVTTCFSELGLTRPGIELWCPTYKANALPLRNRGGRRVRKTTYKNFLVGWCLLLQVTEV